jgi:indole-3-glycerol phosphate synthase
MDLQEVFGASRLESEDRKRHTSFKSLKQRVREMPATLGFARRIAALPFSIIAEIKTKSPSMGSMSLFADFTANRAHFIYQGHSVVSAISVLTQATHFGGSEARLRTVRRQTRKPILRKDFIQDEYEVYFSRAIGADAILLMANVVTDKKKFSDLHALALDLGLDVLCEVHSEDELEIIPTEAKMIGINSRNFRDKKGFLFSKVTRHTGGDASTDLSAFSLYEKLPTNVLKIAESGMTSHNLDGVLQKYPFDAALIGSALLRGDTQAELDRLNRAIVTALPLIESARSAQRSDSVFATS